MAVKYPNKITSENFHKLWCRHAITEPSSSHYASSINTKNRDNEKLDPASCCIGRKCPGLVLTLFNDDDWTGYCGVDHPYPYYIKEIS